MKTTLRTFALASFATVGCLAALLVACGDDDDTVIDPGTDSGTDTGTDSGKDSGADADADSGVIVSDTVDGFRNQVATALCSTLTRCCFGTPDLADGGAIDRAFYDGGFNEDAGFYNAGKCGSSVRDLGFEYSGLGVDAVDAGAIALDKAKAVSCITKLNALACSLSGAELAAARADCFDAVVGSTPNNAPCAASIECQKGAFCNPSVDGGTCLPLVGQGGSCNVFNLPNSGPGGDSEVTNATRDEEACSTRGGGDTGLHCSTYDSTLCDPDHPDVNPNCYRPRSEWVCVPNVAANEGKDCNSTVWCNNGICNSNENYVCESPVNYFQDLGRCLSVTGP